MEDKDRKNKVNSWMRFHVKYMLYRSFCFLAVGQIFALNFQAVMAKPLQSREEGDDPQANY